MRDLKNRKQLKILNERGRRQRQQETQLIFGAWVGLWRRSKRSFVHIVCCEHYNELQYFDTDT